MYAGCEAAYLALHEFPSHELTILNTIPAASVDLTSAPEKPISAKRDSCEAAGAGSSMCA